MPAATATKPVSKKRAALWEALAEFIRRNGGFAVSPPDRWPLRMECAFSSDLPGKLAGLGWELSSTGSVTRVTHNGPQPMESFEIDTPSDIAGL